MSEVIKKEGHHIVPPSDILGTTICSWCGQKEIPVKILMNARGFGYYGVCPKCNKETVVEEIDFTKTI